MHLYVIQMATTGVIKIGKTNDFEKRLGELQTGNPFRLKFIVQAREKGCEERRIHAKLHEYRIRSDGEWFQETGIGSIPEDIWGYVLPWYQENPDWWKGYR